MDRERKPNVFIVAGPNGAGKSTFARLFLPDFGFDKQHVVFEPETFRQIEEEARFS